ncbi:MAG: hypothetical protein PHC88_14710 [Terrimicrobiaceae bacterium]|nr:hypothetical protein [Terrimicrobiaceae bacterium]
MHPAGSLRIAVALLAIVSVHAEPASDALDKFTRQLQAACAAQPSDDGYRRDTISQFKARFEALGLALKRGELNQAREILQNLNGAGLPPELQDAWQSLADALAAQIIQLQQQAAISWKKAVDEAATKTRDVCIAAKTSSDLDGITLEVAALQNKHRQMNNLLVDRANRKLEGITRFLDQWSRFLDFRAAGSITAANNLLRNLRAENDPPIISQKDLERAFIEQLPSPWTTADVPRIAFRDVKNVADLPPAVEKMNELLSNPAIYEAGFFLSDPRDILALVTADQQVKEGNFAAAEEALSDLDRSEVYQTCRRWLQPIRTAIRQRLTAGELQQITGAKPRSDESSNTMLRRVLDGLQAGGEYTKMSDLVTEISMLPATTLYGKVDYPWSPGDATALLAYANASKLEQAGDALAAVNEYRRVITSAQGGKYAPTAEAQKAIERLKKSHPEAFADIDGVVLDELRQIRQELDQALRLQIQQQRMTQQRLFPGNMR